MTSLRKILNRRNLFVLAVIVGAVLVFRWWRASAYVARVRAFSVPIIVSPSVQPGNGESLLFKVSNISTTPVGVRLTLFNDRERFPVDIKEFGTLDAGMTVTYLYNSPPGKLTINGTTLEVPDAVRAVVGPMPAGEPGAMRRVVANMQIVRLQSKAANGSSPSLDAPIIVPLERCMFTARGYLEPVFSEGRLFWDCGSDVRPEMLEAGTSPER